MIPKPGKGHKTAKNYRLISLLTTMSTFFEKLLLLRLKVFIRPREKQHAFRSEHSTTTQLVSILNDLAVNKNEKLQTASLFFDIEKAFNKV